MNHLLEVLSPGSLCSVQDGGRAGFRHLGIPPAGAMDVGAWRLANRLLDNPSLAPALECLPGVRLRVLQPVQLAWVGVGHARAWVAEAEEIIEITPRLSGVWHYLALPGGVAAPKWLGSASVCRRAGIGAAWGKGDRIAGLGHALGAWNSGIRARLPEEDFPAPPTAIRVWPGPQWGDFSAVARRRFLAQDWRVSRQSDRSGYRLEGVALPVPAKSLASEPVRVGSIQVPPDGQPIVCLNDGPTVGGYPKIALIDPADLRWLVQTPVGGTLRFTMAA